jgi:hypothetical protein
VWVCTCVCVCVCVCVRVVAEFLFREKFGWCVRRMNQEGHLDERNNVNLNFEFVVRHRVWLFLVVLNGKWVCCRKAWPWTGILTLNAHLTFTFSCFVVNLVNEPERTFQHDGFNFWGCWKGLCAHGGRHHDRTFDFQDERQPKQNSSLGQSQTDGSVLLVWGLTFGPYIAGATTT